MSERLNESQIIEIFDEYIKSKNTDYAVLLDGSWGSGKTYFIEHSIVDGFKGIELTKNGVKRKIKFIYISVYGIKDVKEIDNKIFDAIIGDFLMKKFSKYYKTINKGLESIYDLIKAFKELPQIPKDSVRNLIEIMQRQKDYIIIFDDIERSELPISELLGYINEFVEHKKIKTIIISNEKEILKKNLYVNTELKYLVAESEILDFPKKKESLDLLFDRNKSSNGNETVRLNKRDICERAKDLFGEDTLYNQIKEKLIGITIFYEPNIEDVTDKILDKYVADNSVKEYIRDNKNILINLMRNKNHVNIRTLKFAISIIEKVLKIINELDLSPYEEKQIDNCKKDIIRYIMIACIKYKDGEWEHIERAEVFNIYGENSINGNYNGFKFVDDIIEKSFVDKIKIEDTIQLYMKSLAENTELYDDPINNLQYYWEMEDKDIENNYIRLKEKLINNLYRISSYSKIVYRVFKLTTIGFSDNYIDDIINIMEEKIKNETELVENNDLAELDFVFSDSKEKEKYDRIMEPIKNAIENKNKNGRKTNINNIINNKEGWGEKFANYCRTNRSMFQSRKEFFNLIDIENIKNIICVSKTKDISDFRRSMYTIYDFKNIIDFYKQDILKLEEFLNAINEIIKDKSFEEFDKSKQYNINWLKKNTEEILERLK